MSRWTRTVAGDAKPRIRLNSQGLWWCTDRATYRSGFGKTPQQAYINWQLEDSKRFIISRAGVRNKQSCMAWWRAGCPPITSYLGNRQFISYLPATDQLVLRGAS